MRIQQNIKRCKEQILYFYKEGPSYENNIANPSQQRIWLVAQQRHAAKHSERQHLSRHWRSFLHVGVPRHSTLPLSEMLGVTI